MSMEPQDGGDEFSETEEGPRGAPRPGWTSSAPCNKTPNSLLSQPVRVRFSVTRSPNIHNWYRGEARGTFKLVV